MFQPLNVERLYTVISLFAENGQRYLYIMRKAFSQDTRQSFEIKMSLKLEHLYGLIEMLQGLTEDMNGVKEKPTNTIEHPLTQSD